MSYVDAKDLEKHLETAKLTVIEGGKQPLRFEREKFENIEPLPGEWLAKHFLPSVGVGVIYGPSTVGKSFVAIYIALRIGVGKHVLGHRVVRRGSLYFVAEGANGFRKRVKAVREKFGMKDVPFQMVARPPNVRDPDHLEAMIAAAIDADAEMRDEHGVGLGLIVIDTIAATSPGADESNGQDMSAYLSNAQVLSQRTGALVLLIGHTGKDVERGLRGWSGIIGNSDVIIQILPDKEDPKLRVGLVEKLKDGENGERFAYRLKEVDMGLDGDGDRVTSAYPAFEEPPPLDGLPKAQRQEKLGDGPEIVLRALRLMLDDGEGVPAPRCPGLRSGTLAVTKLKLKDRAVRIGFADVDEKPDTVRKAFTRALEKLAAKQRVRIEGEHVWPV